MRVVFRALCFIVLVAWAACGVAAAEGEPPAAEAPAPAPPGKGYLGIEPVEATLTVPGQSHPVKGIRIEVMYARKAAHRANLYMGDVITEIDGTPVGSLDDLRAVMARHHAGDTVEVKYWKGGTVPESTSATLSEQPYDDGWDPESGTGW